MSKQVPAVTDAAASDAKNLLKKAARTVAMAGVGGAGVFKTVKKSKLFFVFFLKKKQGIGSNGGVVGQGVL